jgi:cobalamin 5'-phosphate synthase/cobalamin synthase
VTVLTSLALPVNGEVAAADLSASLGWHPLVGLGIGAAAWGIYAGLLSLLPALVAAALVVLALELFTRGLHLDGLMDTFDGYFSGAPRERALEIMKDSRVGAMGVLGAVMLLIVKVAALAALTRAGAAAPLLAGWAAARALPAADVYAWPYARPAGTGAAFTHQRSLRPVVLAAGLAAAAAVLAGLVQHGGGGWWAGLVVAVCAVAVAFLAQAVVARRLGGLTGDVYGMGIEIAEAAALVVACALAR